MNYYHEMLGNSLNEVDALISAYWFATPENEGHVKLDFDWRKYLVMETQGLLQCYTARTDDGEMLGAVIYFVVEHPHHRGYLMANCDTLCTARKARGYGLARQLMAYAEPWLVKLGVKEIVHHARLVYDVEPLFPKLGYTAIETSYSKKVS